MRIWGIWLAFVFFAISVSFFSLRASEQDLSENCRNTTSELGSARRLSDSSTKLAELLAKLAPKAIDWDRLNQWLDPARTATDSKNELPSEEVLTHSLPEPAELLSVFGMKDTPADRKNLEKLLSELGRLFFQRSGLEQSLADLSKENVDPEFFKEIDKSDFVTEEKLTAIELLAYFIHHKILFLDSQPDRAARMALSPRASRPNRYRDRFEANLSWRQRTRLFFRAAFSRDDRVNRGRFLPDDILAWPQIFWSQSMFALRRHLLNSQGVNPALSQRDAVRLAILEDFGDLQERPSDRPSFEFPSVSAQQSFEEAFNRIAARNRMARKDGSSFEDIESVSLSILQSFETGQIDQEQINSSFRLVYDEAIPTALEIWWKDLEKNRNLIRSRLFSKLNENFERVEYWKALYDKDRIREEIESIEQTAGERRAAIRRLREDRKLELLKAKQEFAESFIRAKFLARLIEFRISPEIVSTYYDDPDTLLFGLAALRDAEAELSRNKIKEDERSRYTQSVMEQLAKEADKSLQNAGFQSRSGLHASLLRQFQAMGPFQYVVKHPRLSTASGLASTLVFLAVYFAPAAQSYIFGDKDPATFESIVMNRENIRVAEKFDASFENAWLSVQRHGLSRSERAFILSVLNSPEVASLPVSLQREIEAIHRDNLIETWLDRLVEFGMNPKGNFYDQVYDQVGGEAEQLHMRLGRQVQVLMEAARQIRLRQLMDFEARVEDLREAPQADPNFFQP